MRAHVLIIEDNELSFALADYLLRQAGWTTVRALDGQTGLQLALENAADLILCDLDLPGMDGYEVVQSLRANPAWRSVPLLAFSGTSAEEAHEQALQAGFSGSVSKFTDPGIFITELARYLRADGAEH